MKRLCSIYENYYIWYVVLRIARFHKKAISCLRIDGKKWQNLSYVNLIFVLAYISFLELHNLETLIRNKSDKSFINFFINEKFKKVFYFFIWILSNYVSHEIIKEFWKNSHFENVRADFLRRCKTHFGKLALKWCIFRHILTDIMSLLLIQ